MAHTTKALDARLTELPNPLPLFLTAEEYAAIYGVTAKHVRDLLRDGKLDGVRIGGSWRIPSSVLG